MSQERYTHYPRAILWLVRGGEVRVGDPQADAQPAFMARVESFYLSKTPITNRQYEAFDPDRQRVPASAGDDDPAVGIAFRDACRYCEWYAGVSRKPIRLPTEIEWEYACRGGSAARCFYGDDPSGSDDHAWHVENSDGKLRPLGEKRPNPFGLLGMLGGVWEWTSSLHRPYPLAQDGQDDLETPGRRVLRGGSFRQPRASLGCGVRLGAEPDLRRDDVGFRIARGFEPAGPAKSAR